MKLGKGLLVLVILGLVAVVGFIFTLGSDDPKVAQANNDEFYNMGSGKRGDDPTYAEEIKKNSALTMATRDKTDMLALEVRKLTQEKEQAQRQVQELNANLAQLQTLRQQSEDQTTEALAQIAALQSDITKLANEKVNPSQNSPQVKALENKINTLTQSIQALTTENEQKMQALKTQMEQQSERNVALNVPTVGVSNSASDTVTIASPTRVTYPYGFTPSSDEQATDVFGRLSHLADRASSSLISFGSQNSQSVIKNAENGVPSLTPAASASVKAPEWETVFPVYTLPPNTILSSATLITPIIGRVPSIDGNVSDPFFFQVEVGIDNLAANGHTIPGIAKMFASGYATGIREQSCARGYIDSLTFIFVDGRIVTQGNKSGQGESNQKAIGYLADKWGKPCIRGNYINNAKDYLISRGAASFLEAAAEGLSQSQVTYQQNDSGNYQAILDGSVWSFIFGKGVGGTASEIADYVRDRALNAVDIVYVEQAQNVQIFIDEMVEIDYDSKARKVNYYNEPTATTYYD